MQRKEGRGTDIFMEAIEELGKLPGNNEFLEQLIHVLINRQKQAGNPFGEIHWPGY